MNTIDRLDPVAWMPIRPRADRPAFSLREWLARHWPQRASPANETDPSTHDELAELDARTLADIGAPDTLLARAMARRESHRFEREGLRIGLAGGAWQHW